MTSRQLLEKTTALAKRNPHKARKLAVSIANPWSRSVALAYVARYSGKDAPKIAKMAADASDFCGDAYQRSTVRAWEISALAETGHFKEARVALKQSLLEASNVRYAGSRAEAHLMLIHAAARIGGGETLTVIEALSTTLTAASHWRCKRAVDNASEILYTLDATLAEKFVLRIVDTKIRKKCLARFAGGGAEPRPFFF